MTLLQASYFESRNTTLNRYKIGVEMGSLVPTAQNSQVLGGKPSGTAKPLETCLKPGLDSSVLGSLQQLAVDHPQKIAEVICTTCRKNKHYGPCAKTTKTKPAGKPIKLAGFNQGMYGNGKDSINQEFHISPNYHSATVADSSKTRGRSTVPPEVQAASAFRELNRVSDNYPQGESENMTGALDKVSASIVDSFNRAGVMMAPGPYTRNPYEERPQHLSPPVGQGANDAGYALRCFDSAGKNDATSIENVDSSGADGPFPFA